MTPWTSMTINEALRTVAGHLREDARVAAAAGNHERAYFAELNAKAAEQLAGSKPKPIQREMIL